jgi:septation ring formation regulator EzrA
MSDEFKSWLASYLEKLKELKRIFSDLLAQLGAGHQAFSEANQKYSQVLREIERAEDYKQAALQSYRNNDESELEDFRINKSLLADLEDFLISLGVTV